MTRRRLLVTDPRDQGSDRSAPREPRDPVPTERRGHPCDRDLDVLVASQVPDDALSAEMKLLPKPQDLLDELRAILIGHRLLGTALARREGRITTTGLSLTPLVEHGS